MISNKTVIISCAGMGKRLGIGCTKALVEVCGKPIIVRTLEQLKDVQDIRVVVGYQAEKVIELVKSIRDDVMFVFNNQYRETGTAGSVSLALDGAKEYVLTIDGDLLVHPDDMKTILETNEEFICGGEIETDDPVKLSINEKGEVVRFSREEGQFEWTGVCCIKTSNLIKSNQHVYQMLEPILPKKHLLIRTREIDTINDYYRAEKWIKSEYGSKMVVGILGGMGSYATLDLFKEYLNMFKADKEWERPRIIIDNNCTMPSRVRAILYNEQKDELINQMSLSIKNLIDAGATDILLDCNTSHVFLDEILSNKDYLSLYVHHMIEETAKYCEQNNIKSAYLLASEGTILSNIYKKYFDKHNIAVEYNENDFSIVREFIESVKTNNITDDITKKFVDFVNSLKQTNVVLGCTELPVVYHLCQDRINKKIINPATIVLEKIHSKFLKQA